MVKNCLIIGRTNVGKTQFLLNFAEYMGLKKAQISFRQPGDLKTTRTLSLSQAKKALIGPQPHRTRCLQSVLLTFPSGKVSKEIFLTDTAGLVDGIHEEWEVRKAIAQTLESIRQAHLILHMVDASEIGRWGMEEALSEFDFQLAQFGATRNNYALLANKTDLEGGSKGLEKLKEEAFAATIYPVSALAKKGFKEVKAFVWNNL